jgi:hypothetical protein
LDSIPKGYNDLKKLSQGVYNASKQIQDSSEYISSNTNDISGDSVNIYYASDKVLNRQRSDKMSSKAALHAGATELTCK